jgi:hypothetical protein
MGSNLDGEKAPSLPASISVGHRTVPAGLWFTGCFEEPKLKADTEANFESSYAILVKDMSSADRERLDTALKDIALVETAIYGPLRDAKLYRFPSGEAGAAFQAFGSGIDQAMGSLLDLD